jgi:hypothetical protein
MMWSVMCGGMIVQNAQVWAPDRRDGFEPCGLSDFADMIILLFDVA